MNTSQRIHTNCIMNTGEIEGEVSTPSCRENIRVVWMALIVALDHSSQECFLKLKRLSPPWACLILSNTILIPYRTHALFRFILLYLRIHYVRSLTCRHYEAQSPHKSGWRSSLCMYKNDVGLIQGPMYSQSKKTKLCFISFMSIYSPLYRGFKEWVLGCNLLPVHPAPLWFSTFFFHTRTHARTRTRTHTPTHTHRHTHRTVEYVTLN